MYPTYKEGQIIMIRHTRNFKVGDVVVAILDGKEVIKRITSYNHGSVFLEGDNKHNSTDSRHKGAITDRKILGVVAWPKRNLK